MHRNSGTILRYEEIYWINFDPIGTRHGNLFLLRRNFKFHAFHIVELLNVPIDAIREKKRYLLVTNQPMTFRST
jgi:hypothetical protein